MDNRFELPTVFTVARGLARAFFTGKTCIDCGTTIAEPEGLESGPALRSSTGVTMAWFEMTLPELHTAVLSHSPVCACCHESRQLGVRCSKLATAHPLRSIKPIAISS
jgi:hypothetical protein